MSDAGPKPMSRFPSPWRAAGGLFVAFEGGEGGGKSTQVQRLAEALQASGRAVLVTREPGGTPVGESIRAIVLDPGNAGLDARAEALLFAAARAEHAHRVIRPALEAGAVVITDRYLDSSIAYQGLARGLGVEAVAELSLWGTQDLVPDLTIVLDIAPSIGLARAKDHNRMEAEGLGFHEMVRQGFLGLAGNEPGRYEVIDAALDADSVADAVVARVNEALA